MKKYLPFAVFCLLMANVLVWALSIPFNAAPDESTHFNTVNFIVQQGRLPIFSRDASATYDYVVHAFTNRDQQYFLRRSIQVTYCSMPYIGYIISAVFVKTFSVISPHYATLYSRLTSVCAYAVFVIAVWLLSGIVFKNHRPLRYVFPWFTATIPQVTFLAAYTNNDMISLALAALVIYTWFILYAVPDNRLPNPWLFGAAAGLLIFTKTNYYILIPCTAVIYVWRAFSVAPNRANAGGWLLRVAGTTIVLSSWFLIRNAYLYGEMSGFFIFREVARVFWTPYFDTQKVSFAECVVQLYPVWFNVTYASAIAVFDWMCLFLHQHVYTLSKLISLVAAGGFLHFIFCVAPPGFLRRKLLLYLVLFFLLPLVVLASLGNTYTVAYQAQGRYLFPALIPAAMVFCAGFVLLFRQKTLQISMAVILALAMGSFNAYCLYGVIRPHYAENSFYKELKKSPAGLWNFKQYQ